MRPSSLALLLLLLGCDSDVCDSTDGLPLPMESSTSTTGDPPGEDPTEGPPERVCAPITTSPQVACGLVCVDGLGIELVIVCNLKGADVWDCTLYPRSGPVVGEVYDDLPVWCGGDGKNQ